MLRYHYDLLARNQAGNLVAVIEIKNPKALPMDTARAFLDEVLETGEPLQATYVLVVSQDVGYIWKQQSATPLDRTAWLQFPLRNVLARYTDVESGRRLTETELSLRLRLWLTDMSLGLVPTDEEPERTLAMIGFVAAMRGATVVGDVDVW